MARIRTIKPEFPQSESMGRVSRESRLCFILLWTLADDAGRLRGNSRMLASLLYPYDDDAKKHIDTWLEQLHAEGCIHRYEGLRRSLHPGKQLVEAPEDRQAIGVKDSSVRRILARPRESSRSPLSSQRGKKLRIKEGKVSRKGPRTSRQKGRRRQGVLSRQLSSCTTMRCQSFPESGLWATAARS